MVKVRSDGNGGYDINVQKAMLRRWGPLVGATMLAIGSIGSGLGSEILDMILNKQTVEVRLQNVEQDLEAAALRAEEAADQAGQNTQLLRRIDVQQHDNYREVLVELRSLRETGCAQSSTSSKNANTSGRDSATTVWCSTPG